MLTAKIAKKKQARFLKPVLPLVPEKADSPEDDKAGFITMELKTKAGATATNASKYKKFIRKFEEGSPQQWIDVLNDVKEIWTQNKVDQPRDRSAIIRTILQGESRSCYDGALKDLVPQAEGGEAAELSEEMIQGALDAVAETIFPHRALEQQKRWMRRNMKKPYDLSTRKTAAAITRINNSLPMFPGATETAKFDNNELVELLELSLPTTWRQAFDLKGFIPTDHTKAELIQECKAIEHSEAETTENKENNKRTRKEENEKLGSSGQKGNQKRGEKKNSSNKNYFCSIHGKNLSHDSAGCWDLHPELKPKWAKPSRDDTKEKKKFSKKAFKTDLYLMSRDSDMSRKDVIAKFKQALREEEKELEKEKNKETSDDDDEMSVDAVDLTKEPVPRKVKKTNDGKKKKKILEISEEDDSVEVLDEEADFLKKVRFESAGESSEEESE